MKRTQAGVAFFVIEGRGELGLDSRMASITLNNVPEDLHAQLKAEAEANYRSVDQEALARLQRSMDAEVATRRDQTWVDEAISSGPEEPFSREKFSAAIQSGLNKAKSG